MSKSNFDNSDLCIEVKKDLINIVNNIPCMSQNNQAIRARIGAVVFIQSSDTSHCDERFWAMIMITSDTNIKNQIPYHQTHRFIILVFY